jgi:hypothetical protein
MHEMQADRVGVVLDLLAERVGESAEPAHAHSHCQVLSFDVRRADLRRDLHELTSERWDIPQYSRHLFHLVEDRGPILERKGGDRKWRYRFVVPMMRVYIIMKAFDDGEDPSLLRLVPPEPNAPADSSRSASSCASPSTQAYDGPSRSRTSN